METKHRIKSFAVYIEHRGAVDCLDDAMAGRLFKALFAYAADGTEPEWEDKALTAVFMMFRSQVDRNAEAYREKCAKNAANASRRGKSPVGKAAANAIPPTAAADSGGLPDTAGASDGQRPLAVADGRLPDGDNHKTNYNHKLKNKEDGKEETFKEEKPGKDGDTETSGNGYAGIGEFHKDVPVAATQMEERLACQKENNAVNAGVHGRLSFSTVWGMYGKPVGDVGGLERQWNALPDADKEAVLRYVPLYVAARPDPKYRKNFCNFLTGRTWETERITPAAYGKYGQQENATATDRERTRSDAASLTEELIARCADGGESL